MTTKGLIGIKALDPDTVIDELEAQDEVVFVVKVDSLHDVVAFVEHENMKALSKFVFFTIRAIPGVKNTETTIMLDE